MINIKEYKIFSDQGIATTLIGESLAFFMTVFDAVMIIWVKDG